MKRFAFIAQHGGKISIERLCCMLRITSRGFRAWQDRPISQRQRDDMVLLAHIREEHPSNLRWQQNEVTKHNAVIMLPLPIYLR